MKNSFNDLKTKLTNQDIDSILKLIAYRCRTYTYTKLCARLKYSPSTVPVYGILERLTKTESGAWEYTAGQSYPDEIRTIRNIILKEYRR
jgi:hypothetical protein